MHSDLPGTSSCPQHHHERGDGTCAMQFCQRGASSLHHIRFSPTTNSSKRLFTAATATQRTRVCATCFFGRASRSLEEVLSNLRAGKLARSRPSARSSLERALVLHYFPWLAILFHFFVFIFRRFGDTFCAVLVLLVLVLKVLHIYPIALQVLGEKKERRDQK